MSGKLNWSKVEVQHREAMHGIDWDRPEEMTGKCVRQDQRSSHEQQVPLLASLKHSKKKPGNGAVFGRAELDRQKLTVLGLEPTRRRVATKHVYVPEAEVTRAIRADKLEKARRELEARRLYLENLNPLPREQPPIYTRKATSVVRKLPSVPTGFTRISIGKKSLVLAPNLPAPSRLYDAESQPVCSCNCGIRLTQDALARNAFYVDDSHRRRRKRAWRESFLRPL